MGNKNVFNSIIPSVVFLIFSQIMDMSRIPFFGDFFKNFLTFLYPNAPQFEHTYEPVPLWWFNIFMFFIFVIISIIAYIRVSNIPDKTNRNLAFLIVKKYKALTLIAGSLPLIFSICFGVVSVRLGPAILVGFALPLLVKSIMSLVISLLYLNFYIELLIWFENNIHTNMQRVGQI